MQHLRTLDDPHLRQQWLRAKEELTQEFSVVKDIVNELKRFKDPPGGIGGGAATHDELPSQFSERPLPPRPARRAPDPTPSPPAWSGLDDYGAVDPPSIDDEGSHAQTL